MKTYQWRWWNPLSWYMYQENRQRNVRRVAILTSKHERLIAERSRIDKKLHELYDLERSYIPEDPPDNLKEQMNKLLDEYESVIEDVAAAENLLTHLTHTA